MRHEGQLAGDRGFEPRLTDPESVVLPLDESPAVDSSHFVEHIIAIGHFRGNAGRSREGSAKLLEPSANIGLRLHYRRDLPWSSVVTRGKL